MPPPHSAARPLTSHPRSAAPPNPMPRLFRAARSSKSLDTAGSQREPIPARPPKDGTASALGLPREGAERMAP